MNLYELKNEMIRLESMITDDSVDEEMIKDTLESLNYAFEEKVDNYSRLIKQLEDDSMALENRIDEIQAKYKRTQNIIKHLKDNLINSMTELDKKEVKTELFTIKVQNNGGKNPVEPYKDEDVTSEYLKQVWIPDKDKIRADLEAGKQLTFTRLLERGKHLSIK
mgnify:CR=1 FL=1